MSSNQIAQLRPTGDNELLLSWSLSLSLLVFVFVFVCEPQSDCSDCSLMSQWMVVMRYNCRSWKEANFIQHGDKLTHFPKTFAPSLHFLHFLFHFTYTVHLTFQSIFLTFMVLIQFFPQENRFIWKITFKKFKRFRNQSGKYTNKGIFHKLRDICSITVKLDIFSTDSLALVESFWVKPKNVSTHSKVKRKQRKSLSLDWPN